MLLPRQTTTFSLRRTLSCYGLVAAFKDLPNLHLISCDDGLIYDGEFIFLYDLCCSILEAFSSLRSFFFFVLKLKVNTDLEQLLTCSYSKFRLLKKIQCCCNVLPHLSSLGAPHNHIMFRSPLSGNSCPYISLAARNNMEN